MAQQGVAARVAGLIKESIESLGLELWDVKFLKEGSSWYLRVYIDKDGGVDINDCTDASRLIDPIIDEADPVNVSYFLEVCSPGLERELCEPHHFERYKGADIKVKLIRPRDGQREFSGKLISYDGGVTLLCGEEMFFAKGDIASVRLCDADS